VEVFSTKNLGASPNLRWNPHSQHEFVQIPPSTSILPYILNLVNESFAVNKNHSSREVAQRVVDRFNMYMLRRKGTSASILDSINHGCGFFCSSVYKLICTIIILTVDSVPNTVRRDRMLSFYTFLLLGSGKSNRKLLPINGWATIEQADVFFTGIIWFLQDLFREVLGGSCFMDQVLTYLCSFFACKKLKDTWNSIEKSFFSLMVVQMVHDL